MAGVTASATSASTTFVVSMLKAIQTISSVPETTPISGNEIACWTVSASLVMRLITSPASCLL